MNLLIFPPLYPCELALQGSFRTHERDSFWLVLTRKRHCRSVAAVPWLLPDISTRPCCSRSGVKKPPRHVQVIPQHQLSCSAELFPPSCTTSCCRRSCGWSFCLHICLYQPAKYLHRSRLRVFGSLGWHSAEIEGRLSLLGSLKSIVGYGFLLMSWRALKGK